MLRTKLVCTMGPATFSPEMVRHLVDSGMTMARLNMSHGLREDHLETVALIRRAAREAGTPVAILADLGGPKIRVGKLDSPLFLAEDQEVVIAPEEAVLAGEIPTTYGHLADDVVIGDRVLLDDGLIELRCVGKGGGKARFVVECGGQLKSFKGMNVPGANLSTPSLTERDLEDLDFALEAGVEYVGLSFVRRSADIEELKERVAGRALVVAKIELVRALASIEEIVNATDAVMVARGDLGVEVPFEQVPLAQKRIVQLANYSGRPVIIATQMLDSMIQSPRPTRAEASDVANAVLDGTDAVMLSGETAVGEYPLHAAQAMVRIIREIEGSGVLARGPRYLARPDEWRRGGASRREHAVASCTVDAVRQLGSPAVLVITSSGFSARLVSSYRPPVPIFAVCTEPRTFRQLAPVWGVWPTLAADMPVNYSALSAYGKEAVVRAGVGKPGDSVVVTAGFPFHERGSTNTMRVEQL
ncbi:MAG: pyruvate kinase [Gammaproteobacteria bacterium]|nr:pyruvate kinase [Gammaproteobacteria bacterium]